MEHPWDHQEYDAGEWQPYYRAHETEHYNENRRCTALRCNLMISCVQLPTFDEAASETVL